jgi:hypothetical protein
MMPLVKPLPHYLGGVLGIAALQGFIHAQVIASA